MENKYMTINRFYVIIAGVDASLNLFYDVPIRGFVCKFTRK